MSWTLIFPCDIHVGRERPLHFVSIFILCIRTQYSWYRSFVSLIRCISQTTPRKANSRKVRDDKWDYPARQTSQNWVSELRRKFSPLPPRCAAIIFRFLFPTEDKWRVYDMQETRLAAILSKQLGVHDRRLTGWDEENSSGCLGVEVRKVFERTWSVRIFLFCDQGLCARFSW